MCVTVMSKFWSTGGPVGSDTDSVTWWTPTSACAGLPDSDALPFAPGVSLSQAGRVGARIVRVSPSTSLAVMPYTYVASSVAVVGAVLVKIGGSLTGATVIVTVALGLSSEPSLA